MGVAQALTDDARIIRDRNFGVVDVRMPELFPFETIEAFVVDRAQRLDLALDGDVASPSQHILAIFTAAGRILQVSMTDP